MMYFHINKITSKSYIILVMVSWLSEMKEMTIDVLGYKILPNIQKKKKKKALHASI